MIQKTGLIAGSALLASLAMAFAAQHRDGYKDTPILPGQKWHVHDSDRPYPREVTPGAALGQPPSDALVLFDGSDLSHFCQYAHDDQSTPALDPKWSVDDGTIVTGNGSGTLYTREKFGDCQVHIEWREDPGVKGSGQGRGNSGVFLMGQYEIQVLDSYRSATYADGQAGAIYGQWPPLVNPQRPPGEWQTYDIVFHAPRFKGKKLISRATITLLFNGVLVHEKQALNGPTVHRNVVMQGPQDPTGPLALQDHHAEQPLRFRNIWVRPLGTYDQP